MNFIYDYLNIDTFKSSIDFRERCHHWIDYEIYDSLDDELKKRYIEQFPLPKLNFVMEKEFYTPKIMCKANHMDSYEKNYCDCSDKYNKTLKRLKKILRKK
jgi:hypothetical protein